ncbi:MAG: hypothetical protein AAF318_20025 [Pseudomonadota bacterium]
MASIFDQQSSAYGVTLALRNVLRALERKGVISRAETEELLDNVLQELKAADHTPEAARDAEVTVGLLYHSDRRPEPQG